MKIRIAIASDHAGFDHKEALKAYLQAQNFEIDDFGTNSRESVDYPDYVRPAAQSVSTDKNQLGIVFGGSGNEAIVANRIEGIRCAVVWSERTARLAKEHGNCNMIAIGQRIVSEEEAIVLVQTWLASDFKGGRHQRRIEKIDA
jgi:ribose 5-phosphate isomerase B